MAGLRFFAFLAVTALVFIALTILLHFIFKRIRYVKYIPSVGALAFAIYNVFMVLFGKNEGFEDIARAIFAFIFLVGFLAALICALFLDLVLPRIRSKKRDST